MRLLGRKLEDVKEIKSNSFEKKPNTVIVEIPTNVPFQYSLKQIRALLKNKIIFEKKSVTEKNHHLKLAIYLEAWKLKKIENHIDALKDQIKRRPYIFPTIEFPNFTSLEDVEKLTYKDFIISNYNYYDTIKMDMVA
jgi:hypothetical protein